MFLACHSFRLGLQIYQILHTDQFTKEHYDFCHQLGSLPYPTSFLIFVDFNNLFLVFNSSINFVIYCAVRKSFRERIWSILSRPFKNLARKTSFNSKKSPTTINHTIWKKRNWKIFTVKAFFWQAHFPGLLIPLLWNRPEITKTDGDFTIYIVLTLRYHKPMINDDSHPNFFLYYFINYLHLFLHIFFQIFTIEKILNFWSLNWLHLLVLTE